tara:strand:- start:131 stop:478 length:348 start_codon:yes stop_codon:yes gene_type:complete
MNKFYVKFIILFLSILSFGCQVYSAEILQVSNSSVLLVGDHNRTYTVKIACAEIRPDLEEISVTWLRKQLPRHTKVNLKPKGYLNGALVARVIPINSDIDITEKYISKGLAEDKC